MSNVIKFPRHKLFRCKPGCDGCMFCNGGLASCVTCGGGEASLPTHCPGERMGFDREEMVQQGVADYKNGEWGIKARDA